MHVLHGQGWTIDEEKNAWECIKNLEKGWALRLMQ
jgi:hypothetical protein